MCVARIFLEGGAKMPPTLRVNDEANIIKKLVVLNYDMWRLHILVLMLYTDDTLGYKYEVYESNDDSSV